MADAATPPPDQPWRKIDHRNNAILLFVLAAEKHKCGDVAGALTTARESDRIFKKYTITDKYSEAVISMLKDIGGGVER